MPRLTQAQEDGYVECGECGHAIEQHTTDGCTAVDGCGCPEKWSEAEIRRVRIREGLPGAYRLGELR